MKLILCGLLLLSVELSAQNFHATKYESRNFFSIGLGASGYYGDLQRQLIIPNTSFTAEISHKLTPQLQVRGSLNYFRLSAADMNQKSQDLIERNLSFHSNNLELSVSILIHFAEIYSHRMRPVFNPFIFAGAGIVTVNPRATLDGEKYNLRRFNTEGAGYDPWTYTFPLGFGTKIYVTKEVSLIAEFGYRTTLTDYLDDVSTSYANIKAEAGTRFQLADRSPELGYKGKRPGMQRGNPEKNDGYAIMSFRLEWFFFDHFLMKKSGDQINTLLESTILKGDLQLNGKLLIQGKVEGSLMISGELELGSGGQVDGDIYAESAKISGKITGNIHVSRTLKITGSATISGDVYTQTLVIENGAIMNGKCRCGPSLNSLPTAAKTALQNEEPLRVIGL